MPGEYVMCDYGLEGRSSLLNRLLSLEQGTESKGTRRPLVNIHCALSSSAGRKRAGKNTAFFFVTRPRRPGTVAWRVTTKRAASDRRLDRKAGNRGGMPPAPTLGRLLQTAMATAVAGRRQAAAGRRRLPAAAEAAAAAGTVGRRQRRISGWRYDQRQRRRWQRAAASDAWPARRPQGPSTSM